MVIKTKPKCYSPLLFSSILPILRYTSTSPSELLAGAENQQNNKNLLYKNHITSYYFIVSL
jgi:hypothetical protein